MEPLVTISSRAFASALVKVVVGSSYIVLTGPVTTQPRACCKPTQTEIAEKLREHNETAELIAQGYQTGNVGHTTARNINIREN